MKKSFLGGAIIMLLHIGQITCAQDLLIKHTNVIDVKTGKIQSNVSVRIEDGIIREIGKSVKDSKVRSIDGTDKYLIPGLWDMHGHTWNANGFFPLLLANGVTGIRDMFGSIDSIHKWRKQIEQGFVKGPAIIASGPIVDGPKPIWQGSVALGETSRVAKVIDSLKNQLKVDFIKVYSLLSREVYFKIAAEAKRQNIPFAGHVPNVVTNAEAAAAGQKSFEHLLGFIQECSDSAAYLAALSRGEIKDSVLSNRAARTSMLLRTYNRQKMKELIRKLAGYDVWICPTLVVNRNISKLDDSIFVKDSRLAYMSPMFRTMWNPANDPRFKTATKDYYESSRKMFLIYLDIVREMQESGVKLLAGTDYPNPYCFPGFSLHDELILLTEAGLTPLQALQTATINPARYLNLDEKTGTVEKGKKADLILLDKNPVDNISNIKSIRAVVIGGRLLDRQELDKMLQSQWQPVN
jgi:imidazolonepropionase-like amidohydrolase